ncbi:MAG: Cu(I)-responsive transcriptional regulator [Gemmobacter sp.]
MNISEVAVRAGLPAKTIRYYEEIGLVTPLRADNGYRRYRDPDLHRLAFVARARGLGFSIEDCRALLALYDDRHRASAEVKRIAEDHMRRIEEKIESLRTMHRTLAQLVEACAGDERPDCPILRTIAGSAAAE